MNNQTATAVEESEVGVKKEGLFTLQDLEVVAIHARVGIKTIVTHVDPHPDEFVAIILGREIGSANFPGMKRAPVQTWSKTDPRLAEGPVALAEQGIMLVGIGGGPFDEHKTSHGETKVDMSAIGLMATFLGIDPTQRLGKRLKQIERSDKGNWGPLELGTALMAAYDEGRSQDPSTEARRMQACIGAALYFFHALLIKDIRFDTEGARAFQQAEKREVIVRGTARKVRLAIATTTARTFPAYARSQAGNMADVVIVRNPENGGISILTVKDQFDLTALAVALRVRECQIKGVSSPGWNELSGTGTYPDIEEWYLYDNKGLLLNISRVRPDAPATKIPLDQVVDMTIWAIAGWLPRIQGVNCKDTRKCLWGKCPVFALGLPQCQHLRAEAGRQAQRKVNPKQSVTA